MRKCSSKNPEAEYLLTELIQCIHRRESGPKGIEVFNKLMDEVSKGVKQSRGLRTVQVQNQILLFRLPQSQKQHPVRH